MHFQMRAVDTFLILYLASPVFCANGFRFTSHLGDLRFYSSDRLHVSILGQFFFTFFKSFQTFSLVVSIKATVKVRFLSRILRFYQAYYIPVMHYCHITRDGQIKFQI